MQEHPPAERLRAWGHRWDVGHAAETADAEDQEVGLMHLLRLRLLLAGAAVAHSEAPHARAVAVGLAVAVPPLPPVRRALRLRIDVLRGDDPAPEPDLGEGHEICG